MTEFPGGEAAAWWWELQPKDKPGQFQSGDRRGLARLRRCATVMDAASEPTTLALCRRLGRGEVGLERAALLAAVLAHVHADRIDLSVARQIGVQRNGRSIMSDLRFRLLLQADTPDEQLTGFRRLVLLAGRELNVADLAAGLWRWTDEDAGEKTRRHWIYAYHDAPDFQTSPTTELPIYKDESE
ncbi:type I-E CRISPR-associated protein Cse2/CasB [uncultured Caballeronia sp.]|uniref:type I-E CRISPR-associated protein Cse2/CasB n=1 Tax=uncultured Caballeronia sp. TaxID=1827198 RepID=UPI0035CC3169